MPKLILKGILFLAFLICNCSIAMGGEDFLVGYWPFDEGSGKEVKDASGNGLDGKLVNDPKWVEGKFGKALEFNGQSNYVEVPDARHLAIESDLTFAAWFKPGAAINAANGGYRLMSKNNDYFLLFNYEKIGQLGFLVKDPGGTNYFVHSVTAEWKGGEWYHAAGTFDGKELMIYINGTLEAKSPYSGKVGTSGLTLWVGADDYPNYFPGAVDEVRIYNKALDEAGIKKMMEGPAAVHPSGKLTGLWGEIKSHRLMGL